MRPCGRQSRYKNILLLLGIPDRSTFQPVGLSHCTNWATPSRNSAKRYDNLKFGTGEPKHSVLCRGSPSNINALLAGSFGFLVQRTPHAPPVPGLLGEQDTKMYANICFSCYSIWKVDVCFRYPSHSSPSNITFNFPAASLNNVKKWPILVFMSINEFASFVSLRRKML